MATNNCGNSNCGCTNTYTVTAPCPPSCPEVFNSSCIVYTGTDILCNSTTVISRYDYLDTIITKLVNYICSVQAPVTVVTGSTYIDTTAVIVGNTTTYTISLDMPAVQAYFSPIIAQTVAANVTEGQGIDIAVNPVSNVITISHEDTSSVASPLSSNNSGNTFIQDINFTFDTFGHVTGASVVPGTVVPPVDATLTDAGAASGHVSLVNDGVGPALAVKGIVGGTGITVTTTGTDVTITGSGLDKYSAAATLPGAGQVTITHNLNSLAVVVSVTENGVLPNNALLQGPDYVYTVETLNSIKISDASFGGGDILVTVIG